MLTAETQGNDSGPTLALLAFLMLAAAGTTYAAVRRHARRDVAAAATAAPQAPASGASTAPAGVTRGPSATETAGTVPADSVADTVRAELETGSVAAGSEGEPAVSEPAAEPPATTAEPGTAESVEPSHPATPGAEDEPAAGNEPDDKPPA